MIYAIVLIPTAIWCLRYKYNSREAPEAGRKKTMIQTYRHNTSITENQRKITTSVVQAGESLRGQNGTQDCVVSGRTSLTTVMRQTQNSENQNRREEMEK